MKSFVNYDYNSDFSIHNIPFGVAVFNKEYIACATRIGDIVVDLATLYDFGYFDEIEGLNDNVFEAYTLNEFIELGKPVTNAVRLKIQELLQEGSTLSKDEKSLEECFYNLDEIKMLMPIHIQNYTDFCTHSELKFQNSENSILPNWKEFPTGYHGRASSVVVSGTPIHRPKGQMIEDGKPIFRETQQLDFELELAFIINKNTEMGDSVSASQAEDFIFGMIMLNDWSARDIQNRELMPFLGKNFGSSVSPWVVTLEALEPFRTASPKQEPEVLDYLKFEGNKNYDINLEVYLQPEKGTEALVGKGNCKNMYWNICQLLAHHTVNGCNVEVGDLYAFEIISEEEESSFGSMLELTSGGENPLKLNDGQKRKFIENSDNVIMKGWAEKDGMRVGFGEVAGVILPAK